MVEGRQSAFQADNVGSIPITRSNLSLLYQALSSDLGGIQPPGCPEQSLPAICRCRAEASGRFGAGHPASLLPGIQMSPSDRKGPGGCRRRVSSQVGSTPQRMRGEVPRGLHLAVQNWCRSGFQQFLVPGPRWWIAVVPLDFSQEDCDWGSLRPMSRPGEASNLHVVADVTGSEETQSPGR